MPITNASYPFDPTGVASSNRVQGERQVIPSANGAGFVLLIPFAAPYFRASLQVVHVGTGRQLTEGVDYYCTHNFYEATTKVGQPIYGSITMIDKTITGTVDLTYQTIGGDWTLNQVEIQNILSETLLDPRHTVWEQITELPYAFPPIQHEHDVNDMTGLADVITAINAIVDQLEQSNTGTTQAHINDHNNPHEVTKAQVGLGNVANYPPASVAEAVNGTANDRYMTPSTTKEAIRQQVLLQFQTHASDTNNPHSVTKAQIGLANVDNFATATSSEALAGTSNNRFMTPLLTKNLAQAVATGLMNDHAGRTDNPHNVTKAQVGLGLTPNYPVATTAEATAGVSNERLMTPYLVKTYVDGVYGSSVSAHLNDLNNPHRVTKAQVGLSEVVNLPIATLAAAVAGTDDSGYMTPRLVAAYVNNYTAGGGTGGGVSSAHLTDYNNPHQVTAAQVGAYTSNQVDALLVNKLDRTATAQNSQRLNGLTASEIIQQSRTQFTWPAVTDSDVTYTMLAYYVLPAQLAGLPDVLFYVSGGDGPTSTDTPFYLVRLNLNNAIAMEVQQIAGTYGEMAFGYSYETSNNTLAVFVKSPPQRSSISVSVISDYNAGVGQPSNPTVYAPSDFVLARVTIQDNAVSADASPGEVVFGYNPHHPLPAEPDTAMVMVNVATTATEITDAMNDLVDVSDEYDNWIALSCYDTTLSDASLPDLLGWSWNDTDGVITYPNAGTTLQTLKIPQAYPNYIFEVEVSSTGAENQSLGVLAAGVRELGKDYGIYVMRNPGGTAADSSNNILPGGNIYKRMTVVLNPFTRSAIDLGSRDTGITASASGWDTAGVARIRVEKTGNTLTVSTSQLGSVTIDPTTQVVIDLNSRPELAIFKKPTTIGVAAFKQSNARFKLLSFPGKYRTFIEYLRSNGQDQSIVHYYNGTAWATAQPMGLSNPFIKPGRLYYSPLTSKLYFARRGGTLKPIVL